MPQYRQFRPRFQATDTSLFDMAQLDDIEGTVLHTLMEPQRIIDLGHGRRSQQQIDTAISIVQDLLDDLQAIHRTIPPQRWRPIIIRAVQTKDTLNMIDQTLLKFRDLPGPTNYPPRNWVAGPNGNNCLDIDPLVLRSYEEYRLKDWEQEAHLGVSRSTLYLLRKRYGIKKRGYSDISDVDLNEFIVRILDETSGAGQLGEIFIEGALRGEGVSVPRSRLRSAIKIARPIEGLPPRFAQPFRRRIYYVPFANSLWHIDGHHKLIDWKIVIHGGIDGYSRAVTFMHASDNNRAETVGVLFNHATELWGWPARVRADHGGENLEVKRMMEEARYNITRPFVQGPSVRNQRIERLWGTLQRWSTNDYRAAFKQLESDGHLDRGNALQMWCLHFCYLPMLNRALKNFVNTYNNHKLWTEFHLTPNELHLRSSCEAQSYGIDIFQAPIGFRREDQRRMDRHERQDFEHYGVDEYRTREGQPEDNDPYVKVPRVLKGAEPEITALLGDQGVLEHLGIVAGRPWPPGEDWGRGRYIAVCYALADILGQRGFA